MTTATTYLPVRLFMDKFLWAVRIVHQGDHYGRNLCLVHEKPEPMVEFYDTRYLFSDLGQFVSRYNLSTLLDNHPFGHGLCLDGGEPDWTLSDACFGKVQGWLKNLDLVPEKDLDHV
jgi:hypothetical protein